MADLTIFQLTQILPAAVDSAADLIPLWDNSVTETKKITVADLKTALGTPALANTNIFVGNASNIATAVALTLNATGGTFALSNTGVLTMPNANTSTRGLLTSADWNTFNNKSTIADWASGFGSGTQATSTWSATNAAANVNAAIIPKGTGALLVDLPDGTATGGNARGTSAVDLQHIRTTNVQVASGNNSVIGGGSNNRASGVSSVVSGGTSNIASGDYAFVGGGTENTATQFYHTIGGGYINSTQVGGDAQTIAGGRFNTTGGQYSSIGGGFSNLANANNSTIAGGNDNTIQSSGAGSSIGGGLTNTITAGASSTIAGGASNTINSAATGLSFIGGGTTNSVTGIYSNIVGGDSNTTGSPWSSIVGGQQNTMTSQWGFIGGGFSNNASGNGNTLVGGYDQTLIGSYGFVGGGEQNNYSNGSYSVIVGGQLNVLNSNFGFLGGGYRNQLNEQFTSVLSGREANATLYGMQAYSSGQFSALADAQMATIQMRASITGTAITELFLDGAQYSAGVRAILPATNSIWMARIQIVAVCTAQGNGTTATGAAYVTERTVGIKRLNTTTSLIGAVQTIGTAQADASMSTSVVTITADDTNEALKVEFTPPTTAGTTSTFRVVATVQLTQVKY